MTSDLEYYCRGQSNLFDFAYLLNISQLSFKDFSNFNSVFWQNLSHSLRFLIQKNNKKVVQNVREKVNENIWVDFF